MTTRFSIADLSDMLHVSVTVIRTAVEDLSRQGELTAESFVFGEKNWRLAPSDVKRIQGWIEEATAAGSLPADRPTRVVKRKHIVHKTNHE